MASNRNTIWPVEVKPARRNPLDRGCCWALLVFVWGSGLAMAGCRQGETPVSPNDTIATTPSPSPAPEPEGATPPPTPGISPGPIPTTPTATPQPSPAPPGDDAATNPGSPLPQPYLHQWEPASKVLLAFGAMTITPDQVQWGSGQTSAYLVVDTDGGYLLRLEANPSFYEIANPYIKLIPETDEAGELTSMAVAFYDTETAAQGDNYIMYGSYFVE
jgi:hypothetical protein